MQSLENYAEAVLMRTERHLRLPQSYVCRM